MQHLESFGLSGATITIVASYRSSSLPSLYDSKQHHIANRKTFASKIKQPRSQIQRLSHQSTSLLFIHLYANCAFYVVSYRQATNTSALLNYCLSQVMDKTKRRCDPDCHMHRFAIEHNGYTRLNTKTQFCPKYHREPRLPEPTFPIFNFDGKYYTSAFVLGIDKRALEVNCSLELAEHTRHVKELLLQKQPKIVFPRPNKKHTFCAVCRQTYTNYYPHIMGEEHKAKINSNLFNEYILELQGMYKELHVAHVQEQREIFNLEEKRKGEQEGHGEKGGLDQADNEKYVKAVNMTQIMHKEIVQFIISSDQSQEQSRHSTPRKRYPRKRQESSDSEDSSSSSSSQESYSSEPADGSKKVQEINLESQSNSIEIVMPAKAGKKERTQANKKQGKKGQKDHRSSKKQRAKEQETKNNVQKNQKKDRTKAKERIKQQKPKAKPAIQSAIVLDQQPAKYDTNPKKAGVDAKKPQENINKTQLKRKLNGIIQNKRPNETLIIKSKTNDPMEQKSMQTILNKIVSTINPVKTVKHNEINLIDQPTNISFADNTPPQRQAKLKTAFDSPFAPPTLKKVRQQQNLKNSMTKISNIASNITVNIINYNQPKQVQSKPIIVQNTISINSQVLKPLPPQKNYLHFNPGQNQTSKYAQTNKNVKNVTFKIEKQIIPPKVIENANKRKNTEETRRAEFAGPLKRQPSIQIYQNKSKKIITQTHSTENRVNRVITLDDENQVEAHVQVKRKVGKKRTNQLQLIKEYEEKVCFSQEMNNNQAESVPGPFAGANNRSSKQPSQYERLLSDMPISSKAYFSHDLLCSIQLQTHKVSPITIPKLPSLISTNDKDEKDEMAQLYLQKGNSLNGYKQIVVEYQFSLPLYVRCIHEQFYSQRSTILESILRADSGED